MKICLVNLRALPVLSEAHKHERIGGEEVQHALLAKAMVALGHEVRLIVGDFGQRDGEVHEGVTTIKSFKEGMGSVRICTSLWAALKRADADVYYYSCAGPMLGVIAAFCDHHGKRLVYRVARDDDTDPAKVDIKSSVHRALYHFGLRRADAVLVQTQRQQNDLMRHHGITSKVAGMLVDVPKHRVTPSYDVLWVANIKPEKRPELLLELASRLPMRTFHMVGAMMPGHEGLFRSITEQARALPNVTFHGKVPYRDIGALFDRCRLFCNTSELEGFPNTFLQAWVRGIPVATLFDPDGIVASKGLGASRATAAALEYDIDRLLRGWLLYEATADRVRTFALDTLSPNRVIGAYLRAFFPIIPYDWLDDERVGLGVI